MNIFSSFSVDAELSICRLSDPSDTATDMSSFSRTPDCTNSFRNHHARQRPRQDGFNRWPPESSRGLVDNAGGTAGAVNEYHTKNNILRALVWRGRTISSLIKPTGVFADPPSSTRQCADERRLWRSNQAQIAEKHVTHLCGGRERNIDGFSSSRIFPSTQHRVESRGMEMRWSTSLQHYQTRPCEPYHFSSTFASWPDRPNRTDVCYPHTSTSSVRYAPDIIQLYKPVTSSMRRMRRMRRTHSISRSNVLAQCISMFSLNHKHCDHQQSASAAILHVR
jgi:hypothetical protein